MTELELYADNILSAANPTTQKEHISAVNLSMQEINNILNEAQVRCRNIINRFRSKVLSLTHKTICKRVLHISGSNCRTSSCRKTVKKDVSSSKSSDSDGPGDRVNHCSFHPFYDLIFILFSIFPLQPSLFAVTSAEEMAK